MSSDQKKIIKKGRRAKSDEKKENLLQEKKRKNHPLGNIESRNATSDHILLIEIKIRGWRKSMSFLHSHSNERIKSELDLFSLSPTQISIESSQWIYYKHVISLSDAHS